MTQPQPLRWISLGTFAAAALVAALAGPGWSSASALLQESSGGPPPPPRWMCYQCLGTDKMKSQEAAAPIPGWQCSQVAPVNYHGGENYYSAEDLKSGGLSGWGITRAYVNDPAAADGNFGPNWRITRQYRLVRRGNLIEAIAGQTPEASWTDAGGGVYTPHFNYVMTLTADTVNHLLVVTDAEGKVWKFHDFSGFWSASRQGALKECRDPASNVTTLTYSATSGPTFDKILEVLQSDASDPTTFHRFTYAYNLAGAAIGKLASVTYTQTKASVTTTVRRADYTYYASSGSNGPAGSLQRARMTDGTNILDTFYHRYNLPDAGGWVALRYVVQPKSYERLLTAYGSDAAIDALSDANLATFADFYFEYDAQHRVTKETVQGKGCGCGSGGGKGTWTYAFATASHGAADGPNVWRNKCTVTMPDGNLEAVYTNVYGQTMLHVFKEIATGLEWKTYYQFSAADTSLIAKAMPSAVTGYDENQPGLVTAAHLPDGTGLWELTEYYASTNLPSGAVAKYVSARKIRQGETGSPVTLETLTYTSRAGNGTTIYPLLGQTVYRNTDGTGGATTSYAYTWQGTTTQILQKTTTHPVVTAIQNGSGSATSNVRQADAYGRITWVKDEDGYIQATEFDPLSGSVTKRIVDVNTSMSTNEPAGWVTPAGGGLHLTTSFRVDGLGRTTKLTDPNGNVTYTVFRDLQHEVRIYPGWTGTATTGPTVLSREDRVGNYLETLTMSATPALNGSEPAGTEAVANVQSLQRTFLDTGDRPVNVDSYFSFSGLTYTTSTSLGTLGTHFYRRIVNYDAKGRQDRDVDWTGTIRRMVFDARGRFKSAWIGTDDIPTVGDWSPTNTAGTNLVKTAEEEYDAAGLGNGNLTRSREFTASAVSLDTHFQYDWRDRRTDERSPANVAVRSVYDNLGRVTASETYASADFTYAAGELRAKTELKFDEKGQLYQTIVHHVHPTTGAIGNRLTSNSWSNARGLPIKVRGANGQFQKTAYDGAARPVASFVGFQDAESAYADADDVAGDTVVSQIVRAYDGAGNAIQTTSYARTSSSAKSGDLSASWAETDSRRSYEASWFDAGNRATSSVDYGRNGGLALVRPPTPPAPNMSDAYIVAKAEFDAGGRAYRTTDNKGRITERSFDLLGRVTRSVENYVDGSVGNAEYDSDRVVERLYDSSGRLSQIKARNPKGTSVEDQFTTYVYGTDANVATPAVYRNDVLVGEIYPDSDDTYNPAGAAGAKLGNGTDATYDRVEHTYDYASRKVTWKLQLTTLHTYVYDGVGRLSQDQATTLGSGIDGAVRRIVYAYDDLSRPSTVSSYSTATGGTLLNQVAFAYDGWGNETGCAQGHEGTATGAPGYTKTYADGAVSGEAKYVRLASVTYPNGRVVHYNYPAAGTVGDKLSRVDNLAHDASGTLKFAQYTYLGAGGVVKVAHPQVTGGLNLDYGTGTGNPAGWDEFGRVDDQKWQSDAAAVKDRYQYGYDRTSSRTFRDNLTATGKDELFVMDGLDRLVTGKRGDLNAGRTDITGTPAFQETWTLEGLGNWKQLLRSAAGTTTLNQTRTHTKANETTTIAATVGTNWGDGAVDRNGNMTRVPKPATLNLRWRLTCDAWGRLVRVVDDVTPNPTIAEYKYDGLHRRTVKLRFLTATTWDRRDYYYSCQWQAVEERELLNQTSKTVVATAPKFQNVWDLRYVDAIALRDENKDGDGDCVDGGDQRLYYAQDANMNVTALVDTAGSVVERAQYDAYGNHALFTADWTTSQASTVYANEILFAGYRHAPESGLYQARSREYHAALGRWTRRDPIGYAGQSLDLYEYVGSAPANWVDPTGTKHCGLKITGTQLVMPAGNLVPEGLNSMNISELKVTLAGNNDETHKECSDSDHNGCCAIAGWFGHMAQAQSKNLKMADGSRGDPFKIQDKTGLFVPSATQEAGVDKQGHGIPLSKARDTKKSGHPGNLELLSVEGPGEYSLYSRWHDATVNTIYKYYEKFGGTTGSNFTHHLMPLKGNPYKVTLPYTAALVDTCNGNTVIQVLQKKDKFLKLVVGSESGKLNSFESKPTLEDIP